MLIDQLNSQREKGPLFQFMQIDQAYKGNNGRGLKANRGESISGAVIVGGGSMRVFLKPLQQVSDLPQYHPRAFYPGRHKYIRNPLTRLPYFNMILFSEYVGGGITKSVSENNGRKKIQCRSKRSRCEKHRRSDSTKSRRAPQKPMIIRFYMTYLNWTPDYPISIPVGPPS